MSSNEEMIRCVLGSTMCSYIVFFLLVFVYFPVYCFSYGIDMMDLARMVFELD